MRFVRAAQRGDVAAFNRLVLLYQDATYTIALRLLGEPHLAADAVQNAFLLAYRHIGSFQAGSFRAWLGRIVANQCYDELRRTDRKRTLDLDDLPGGDSDDGAYLPDSSPSPETLAERSELMRAIQQCIAALAIDQRMVLVLSDVEGFTYQEIAEQVGAQLGTVKSRLSRARASVRDCLRAVQELLPADYRL
jgi:RNA polymerase sigma-70 factor (ECF subfamily)